MDNSRKYYNFLLNKKISKSLNAIKKLRNAVKLSIMDWRLEEKSIIQQVIARNWLSFYHKKKAISKCIAEFIEEDKSQFQDMNEDTENILFPNLANKRNEEMDKNNNDNQGGLNNFSQNQYKNNENQTKMMNTNNNNNNNFNSSNIGMQGLTNRKLAFNNDNSRNKQYMQMQRYNLQIPNFDYYGEMKIVLFAKIIDLDSIVN